MSAKNPIANHYGWQGKVYKLHGSDGEYPNLTECTGYPDDIEGLGGVNCRHRMFPFFPGFSIPNPVQYDEQENKERYQAEQKQRKLERDIRGLKKEIAAMNVIGADDEVKILNKKLNDKFAEINAHCDKYGLRRDYSRELVKEQIVKKKMNNKAENINSGLKNNYKNVIVESTTGEDVPPLKLIGKIDKNIYSCVTDDITTDEVIITDERIDHIKERHPNDYEEYYDHLVNAVQNPDYIIEANKPKTALALKEITQTNENFYVVVRLLTSSDDPSFKNSVITFMKIKRKEWDRLLRNKKILYKKE